MQQKVTSSQNWEHSQNFWKKSRIWNMYADAAQRASALVKQWKKAEKSREAKSKVLVATLRIQAKREKNGQKKKELYAKASQRKKDWHEHSVKIKKKMEKEKAR